MSWQYNNNDDDNKTRIYIIYLPTYGLMANHGTTGVTF